MEIIVIVDCNIEVADEITREVELCHLIKQFVLIHRVGLIDKHEVELRVALGTQWLRLELRTVAQHLTPSCPYISNVKVGTVQSFATLHSIDDHARNLRDLTFRVFLHERVEILHTLLAVAFIEFSECPYKQELIAVGSLWEARL